MFSLWIPTSGGGCGKGGGREEWECWWESSHKIRLSRNQVVVLVKMYLTGPACYLPFEE